MAKRRDEFKNIYKWQREDLFKDDEACLKAIAKVEKEIKKLAKYKEHILDSANSLEELLNLDSNISQMIERIYIYGSIYHDEDTTNAEAQIIFGKAKNIYVTYLEASSYVIPELLESDYELVKKYIKENSNLKEYARLLKSIYRRKAHVLSKETEETLASFGKVFSAPDEIMSTLSDSDFRFDNIIKDGKSVELTESNFSLYLKDKDRSVREQAFKSLYKTYEQYKNTIAIILKNEVEKNVASARVRKYKNSLEASLFDNEIDVKVYYNLINGVHKHLKTLDKYWLIKKEELGLKDFHIYDTYTDISKDNNKKYTFEDAKNLVLEITKPLGEKYHKDLEQAFNKGWIDSCNNAGKRGGAYCTSCYNVHPYVLLSYEGTLQDISTLAHELGHAMHYYYATQAQKYQDYGYSIFVAEVASQVNEILLSRYLLDKSNDKEEKKAIIDELLQKYKASVFRQTMFAEFELFIHEFTEQGNVLTHENMCEKYYELNKLYYGNNVVVDKEIRYEWERIPHFYMDFYVYQYATSFTAAIAIANKLYENDTKTRDKYLEFLKLGCTKDPIASLKVVGIDMTKEEVLDDAISFMDKLLLMYEELGKK